MKKIDLFLFDLDGTLIDSKQDIASSVNFTMTKLGLAPLAEDLIYRFVGNGVTPLIQQTVEAAGGAPFDQALEIFRKHYDGHLLDATETFPGVRETLKRFEAKTKVVVTNKSQAFSEKILRGLDLGRTFVGVFGGDTAFPKKPAPDVVRHLLETYEISPRHAVIVGDSRVDMETGKNAGILTCGVTYGFRPRSELEDAKPDFLIDRFSELADLFF
ncbi:MAG TPA: HAD-IA family hydrolase [bacterium]|nr:HAD-IA family hydrolase [bacterium]